MTSRFDIVRNRKWFFLLSGTITVLGLIVFLLFGFNLGPDFKSGSRIQLQVSGRVDTTKVSQMFQSLGVTVRPQDVTVGGNTGNLAIVRLSGQLPVSPEQLKSAEQKYLNSTAFGVDTVSPYEANIISRKAVWSVLLASLFIVIYVAIRFEFRFAVSGVVALLHNAFIVMAVFALLRLEVDLLFITAVLTIVGYSINDTIVIFDRIRENVRAVKPKTFEDLQGVVNKSLWQTMARSINTVAAVLIAALMLYFFGGQTIHTFTFALIVGLISGAYCSIFIASPLWVVWRGYNMKRAKPASAKPTT